MNCARSPRHSSPKTWLLPLGLSVLASCATPHRLAPALPSAAPPVPAPAARLVTAAEDPAQGPCISTARGCVALNPDVSPATVHGTICASGYTRQIRPASSYTRAVKLRLLQEAGLAPEQAGLYELDHVVPLALGGHPRRLSNLRLQPWDGPEGAHAKDAIEVHLQHLVCQDRLGLREAQACMAQDWLSCAALDPPRR